MAKSVVLLSAKKHPIAATIYTLYISVWLLLCYLTYYFLIQADADTLQSILFYWCLGFCAPYMLVNIVLSYRDKKDGSFYTSMAKLIFMPVGLMLLVFIAHGTVAYINKGI